MTTPDYTIQTSFTLVPKPSENFSESSNLTPTTPSTLSDSPLVTSGSDCDQINAICEQLITEKETMAKQIELSNSELNDLKNKLLQAARQKQALNKAHIKITELETKNLELTEENAKLKIQNQQNEELVKSSQKYQIIMEQNIQEVRMLTTKRVEAEKAIHHLQQENLQYKLKLEKVLNALNTSEESKEDLWATIEEQEKQIELQFKLSSENQALTQEVLELRKQLEETKAENSQELAQSQKDVRQLKLHNVQLQALLREKSQELDQHKQELPSIRIESERSLTDRFGPGTPSTACSRSMTTVPKNPCSDSGRVKFIRMKKESMTPTSARSGDIEKKILSVLTERRKLTKQNDNLVEKIKEQRKEFDQLNYFTTILNAPQSARERRVHVSRLPSEWEEKDQASPVKPFSRLIVKREIAQEELRRKNKSAALFERGNAPIHAL
jgi:hypothetical protein